MGRHLREVIVIGLALSATGCKLKVDATVQGPSFGAPDKVRVKIEGTSGAELSCSDGACAPKRLSYSGEVIDVKIPQGENKIVTITARKGLRTGSTTVDFSAGGQGATLEVKKGAITCLPIGCKGRIDIAPASKVTLEAPADTTLDVGGEKLTVPAGGSLAAPLKLAVSPSMEKQPLDKICTGGASSASTVLTSTTLTLTMPGKQPIATKVDLDIALAEQGIALALLEAKKGPVVFPWEKPGEAAKGKKAAIYSDGFRCYDAGTTGATLADLDIIAISDTDTREDKCVYVLTTGGTAEGAITLYDEKVTVYDRITGRTLATKKFEAPKTCTSEITVKSTSSNVNRQTSFVSKEAIAKWAATFAK